jgi:two-component system, chemotaxis family, CheB/CheR fusion protein
VTNFFRDPAAWEQLRTRPSRRCWRAGRPATGLRAWVPGCSTGEEAYSLAIVFKEAVEQRQAQGQRFAMQIFATDLDRDAIDKARQGLFPRTSPPTSRRSG